VAISGRLAIPVAGIPSQTRRVSSTRAMASG
jgi:hypothetical protein